MIKMTRIKLKLAVVGVIFSFFALHSFATEENFAAAWPAITFYTKTKIRIAVIDDRPYVKSGKYGNYYVGVIRTIHGIPMSVNTVDAVPLAGDLEKAISSGFANAGMDSSVADVTTKTNLRTSAPDEKLVVVTLSEWVSDSYMNSVGFSHKATTGVYDSDGNRLATEFSEGTKTFTSPMDGCRDALTQILSSKVIVGSLSSKKAPQSATPSPVGGDRMAELATGNDAKSRLLKLKDLLNSGAITNADYEQKKSDILRSM